MGTAAIILGSSAVVVLLLAGAAYAVRSRRSARPAGAAGPPTHLPSRPPAPHPQPDPPMPSLRETHATLAPPSPFDTPPSAWRDVVPRTMPGTAPGTPGIPGHAPGYAAPAAPEWNPPQVYRQPAPPANYGYPTASPAPPSSTPSSLSAPASPPPPSLPVPPSWPSLTPASQLLPSSAPAWPGMAGGPARGERGDANDAFAALVREYWQRIRVSHDAASDAITIAFDHCRLHTADEITVAFRVLSEQVRRLLAAQGRSRSALLVDIAGLDIGGDVTPLWGRALKEFLERACIATGPERYLIARYNSSAAAGPLSPEALQAVVTRVQIMTEAAIEGFQSNILGSREEAVAVLARIRELAGGPRR